ncbi:MAG: hypothetical protein QMD11_02670 [Smithella sp.]|nr:hypothetical protein [Smithella sp.]
MGGALGSGEFTQGLAGGIQNAMQMRRQSMDNQMRADYMKTQKKLLDAQWKAAEMEEQWWNQQPSNVRGLKFMPKEAQTIGMLMAGIIPLPGMTPVAGAPGAPPSPGPAGAQPAGLDVPPMALPENLPIQPPQSQDNVVDIITQARTNPMLGLTLNKIFGENPGRVTFRDDYLSPKTGKPALQGFDTAGRPIPEVSYGRAAQREERAQQTQFIDPDSGMPLTFNPLTRTYDVANVPGLKEVGIRKQRLPVETSNDIAQGMTYLQTVDKIKGLYNKALAGPAAGRANIAAQHIMNNPEFKAAQFNIGTLRTIVYQLSGKQINETELKWLERDILPSLKQPNENFAANLKQLDEWLTLKLTNQTDALGTNYILPKNVQNFIMQRMGQAPKQPSLNLGGKKSGAQKVGRFVVEEE